MINYNISISETFGDYALLKSQENVRTTPSGKILIKIKDLRKVMIQNDNLFQQRSPFWA